MKVPTSASGPLHEKDVFTPISLPLTFHALTVTRQVSPPARRFVVGPLPVLIWWCGILRVKVNVIGELSSLLFDAMVFAEASGTENAKIENSRQARSSTRHGFKYKTRIKSSL
jgi:hypothetical protein